MVGRIVDEGCGCQFGEVAKWDGLADRCHFGKITFKGCMMKGLNGSLVLNLNSLGKSC